MTYLSICSGIEAASVAWEPLGWKPCAFAEIEKFPSAVLAHHWPDVPNLGDMTKHNEWPDTLRPNLIVGGTPCQAFSVAGLRKGLEDPRGNLTLVFLGILAQFRPKWVVWENVPGVLSDKTGAFGAFLGGLGELGYGFAYRVLDAQHFGVPQRRRRVFVVGCLGSWQSAAAVLFEPESLRGDSPPSREKGQGSTYDIAPCIAASGRGTARTGETRDQDCLIPDWPAQVTPTLNAAFGSKLGLENQHIDGGAGCFVPATYGIPGNWIGRKPENGGNATEPMHDVSPCLTKADKHAVAFSKGYFRCGSGHSPQDDGTTNTLQCNTGDQRISVAHATAVRRLTPTECERLQGFPDGHTLIPWRGKEAENCPDGPRYKALGNSMAVPVMRWIGEGIKVIEKPLAKREG